MQPSKLVFCQSDISILTFGCCLQPIRVQLALPYALAESPPPRFWPDIGIGGYPQGEIGWYLQCNGSIRLRGVHHVHRPRLRNWQTLQTKETPCIIPIHTI